MRGGLIGPVQESFTIAVGGGTPGADANTYVLFDSPTAFGAKVMRSLGVSRIIFGVKNSQAGTLNASRSIDGGVTWTVYDTRAVAIAAANTISGPFDYLVDTYKDWKLEWVNGGVAQGTWLPEMTGICGDRASGI